MSGTPRSFSWPGAGLRGRLRHGLAVRRLRGAQEGFVLAFVLGIIALTSTLIIALLGLSLTSARVARDQAELAREARAADGALEVAVDSIATSGGEACSSLPSDTLTTIPFAGAGGTALPVRLTCGAAPPPGSPDADMPGPDVEVVGTDAYEGSVTAPSVPGVDDPNLVYAGADEELRFDSDVRVNTGAAPERQSGPGGSRPAVDVAGQYTQRRQPTAGGCGALAAAPAEGAPSHQITDFNGAPVCNPDVPAITPELSAPTALAPASSGIATCGTTTVTAGRYSRAQIEALNDVLGDGSTCSATVVFAPGVHILDVYDTAGGKTGDARFVLDISNPNALVVGGQPVPGLSAASFPDACDRDAEGVTFELSGRSAIRHTAGRVALCPRKAGQALLPVITQTGEVDVQPTLVSVSSAEFSQPQRLAQNGEFSTTTLCHLCNRSFSTVWSSTGTAALTSAWMTMDQRQVPTFFGSTQAPWSYFGERVFVQLLVSGPVSCSTSAQQAGRSLGGTLAYNLLDGGCATALQNERDLDGATITARFTRSNDEGVALSLSIGVKDVRLEVNRLRLAAQNAEGSKWTNPQGAIGSGEASVAQDAASGTPPSAWEVFTRPPEGFRGQEYPLSVSGFTLPEGVDEADRVSSLAARLRSPDLNTIRSVVTDPADGTAVDLTFTRSDGVTCSTDDNLVHHRSQAQSRQELRYDLFSEGDCGDVITSMGQIVGGTLTATIRTGCLGESTFTGLVRPVLENPGDPNSRCKSVRVPIVDDLGLVVGTDAVDERPPYSLVSVDTGIDASRPASFDVFGPVLLPRTDLDVVWRGEHFDRPLFGDRLQVHGLGSRQDSASASVGSVCCGQFADNGVAVVRALIQDSAGRWVPRGLATVKVGAGDGTPADPRPVDPIEWRLCGRGRDVAGVVYTDCGSSVP